MTLTAPTEGGPARVMGSPPALFSYTRPEQYSEVAVIRDIMMPARDGTRLSTDVYLPARGGVPVAERVPAILDRTPYDKAIRGPFVNDPEFLTKRGYAFVFQDTRGHGGSEGNFRLWGLGHDGIDGYDAVEWIAAQPWCDGRVFTSGWSADCMTQLSLAVERPPHLQGMYLAHGPSNYYQELGGSNGALRLCHGLAYSFRNAFLDTNVKADPVLRAALEEYYADIETWYRRPPSEYLKIFEGVPSMQRWLKEWLHNREFNDYWKQPGYNFEEYHQKLPDIPMFFMGAWYDFFLRGTIRNFVGLSKVHTSKKFLLITPSLHGPGPSKRSWQGEVFFGAHAKVEWNNLRLAFFDECVGRQTGHFERSWARVFVMGGGDSSAVPVGDGALPITVYGRWAAEGAQPHRVKMNHGGKWAEAEQWPLPNTEQVPYYLHGDRSLRLDPPKGDVPPTAYYFDPARPCPQIGGDWTHRPRFISQPGLVSTGKDNEVLTGPGPRDQVSRRGWLGCEDDLPLWSRPDVVSFETSPLAEPVELIGDVSVVLYVASSAPDTDFTFKLIDQCPPTKDYPRGFAMLLRDGIMRCRYRNSFERAELMTPGTVYELTVDLWATANLFQPGHRIRLDISSSNFPSFDVNPNTGEDIGFHTHQVVAENSVYHDSQHPSRLLLRVRKAGRQS